MDIHTDGEFDLDKARAELAATASVNNEAHRRIRIAELQIATLLDIASSLRVVALEAAVNGLGEERDTYPPDAEPDDEITRDFLLVGDLVHIIGESEPGEVMALGFDQGDPFAIVDFATAKGMRYYVRNLERIVGNTEPNEAEVDMVDVVVAALGSKMDGTAALPAPEDLVDDIDADFDGEPTPAADDALEILKANEAARKAAKKGKKR